MITLSLSLVIACRPDSERDMQEIHRHLMSARAKLHSARLCVTSTANHGPAFYAGQNGSNQDIPKQVVGKAIWTFMDDKIQLESIDSKGRVTTSDGTVGGRRIESPLEYGYQIAGRWATEVVDEKNFEVVSRAKDNLYGPTIQLRGKSKEFLPYGLWIAPAAGYLIVKTQWTSGGNTIVHRLLSAKSFHGAPVPMKTLLSWDVMLDGRAQSYLSVIQEMTSASANDLRDEVLKHH